MRCILGLAIVTLLSACGIIDHYRDTRTYGEIERERIQDENARLRAEHEYMENKYAVDDFHGKKHISKHNVMPEVYTIVATRAVNKMLDETKNIYSKPEKTYLFIKDVEKEEDIPNGVYLAETTVKEIIESSRTYTVVNSIEEADYQLESFVGKITVQGYMNKIIQYKMTLLDKKGEKVKEYIETIRETKNSDNSWW